MQLEEFIKLIPARQRRTLKRGISVQQKSVLKRLQLKRPVKTHSRDMVIIPSMVGATINIYNGKTFNPITILPEMLGHRLGEFSMTRQRVAHSAPGIGATRSSASVSVR